MHKIILFYSHRFIKFKFVKLLLKQTKNNSHTETLDQDEVVLKQARRILR